jgi:hypothetical protein
VKKHRRWTFAGLIAISIVSTMLIALAASCALEPREFAITFNPDGGTGTMEQLSAEAGKSIRLPANSFTKGSDSFDGWLGISPDGTVLEFDDQDEIEMPTHDLELFACWDNGLPKASLPSAVGTIGPSGGYIFFDKGEFVDGWQYMEAAPSDIKIEIAPGAIYVEDPYGLSWGEFPSVYKDENNDKKYIVTKSSFGKGKENTASILAAGKGKDSAAKRCDDWVVKNGGVDYDDWFLPSSYELSRMYSVLYRNNKGSFSDYVYWSSTESVQQDYFTYDASSAFFQAFGDSHSSFKYAEKGARFRVRPVRMY